MKFKFTAMALAALLSIASAGIAFAGEISTVGTGIIYAQPDQASISFGIVVTNEDVTAAKDENAVISERVISELIAAGVKEENITTSYYSVNPRYKYGNDDERTLYAYEVSNNLSVKTNEVDRASEIIDIGIRAGATESYGPEFSVSDTNKYYSDAIGLAINNSRQTAEAMASSMGVTITGTKSVSENRNSASYLARDMDDSAGGAATKESSAVRSDIRYGKMEITASISAVYEY